MAFLREAGMEPAATRPSAANVCTISATDVQSVGSLTAAEKYLMRWGLHDGWIEAKAKSNVVVDRRFNSWRQ